MVKQCEYSAVLLREEQWAEWLAYFPEHTVFHTLAWLQAVAAAHDLDLILMASTMAGYCAAVWPCLVMRKGPFRIVGSPLPGWSTPYLGPLFAQEVDEAQALRSMLGHPALKRYT